ncbi:hypothetical protein FJT64_010906 [Amphibalanus amphitrite]|uniref:Uncharacterized protein n=1 Tax=Amphibalanus amphitrite TaxID=1232801 RepID=A0A6A4V3N8_AMPAM|nr:hypothetical protein FJT64_010906 [Amphibalanus amphitrite]
MTKHRCPCTGRLPVWAAAAAVLLVLLPAARCQHPEVAAGGAPPVSGAEGAAAGRREMAGAADYESLLSEAAAAWLQQQHEEQEEPEVPGLPSSLRSPASGGGGGGGGLLQQLLRPSGGGKQGDLGSLLGSLLSSQTGGGGGGGGGGLAALLTTTTARPTRIFDKYVIRDGNPFATQRPKTPADGVTPNPLSSVTSKTTEADEADKFDAGFQIFSQIFSGNNAVDGGAADSFADAPALQLTTTSTTRATPPPPTARPAPAAPAGWPFYTTPRPEPAVTSHQPPPPPPPQQPPQQLPHHQPQQPPHHQPPQHNFNGFNNGLDKQDFFRPSPPTRAPRPPGVPFYYNPDAPPGGPPPASNEPEPQIQLGVLLSSVTQLVRSDGPSMIAALGDAYTYIQEGNVLGLLQGVVPVFSRATPVIMNMLSSVAPVVEKSDLYGPPIPGSPGLGGLFGSFSGLFGGGRRRPQRRQPLVRNTPPGYSQPFYMGQVIGSGLKLITYLINHGTTVVRAREPSDFTWLRDALRPENVAFVRDWLLRATSGQS